MADRVQVAFATSRYRTRQEFEAEAYQTKDTAMRDFATRIGHWIELPALNVVPEQKLLVCATSKKGSFCGLDPDRAERLWAYLDLGLGSIRSLERFNPETAKDRVELYYPTWVVLSLPVDNGKLTEPVGNGLDFLFAKAPQ